jgi:LacI family transcriptional regulator
MYAFGGNRATVEAFAAEGGRTGCFVAHDLHEHNLALLHDGHLSAVLHTTCARTCATPAR